MGKIKGEKEIRQRRPIKDTVGFNRHKLIPEEDSPYEAPENFPPDAQRYLEGLARCGTLSGGAQLAGIGARRVYAMRKQIEGFLDEEEIAKDCLTDVEEEALFDLGLNAKSEMAKVKALEKILKANRSEKYDRTQKHEIEGEIQMTWLDLLREQEKESLNSS